MGTTAQKLDYLNTTKQQIKSALKTQSNVFRDYVPLIQKYINNNPSSTVTNGIASNALDVPVKNYKVFGNSTQESTTGKNIFNPTLLSQESNYNTYDSTTGLWTTSNDGSYFRSILYNASGNNHIVTPSRTINVKPETDYKIKIFDFVNDTDTANLPISISFGDSEGTKISDTRINSEDTFTTPINCHYMDLRRLAGTGTFSFSKILIQEASITDMSWEPYTGGIPSPNPDYPSEITSVGDLVTEGEHTGKYKVPVKVRGKNVAYTGWAEDFVTRINDDTKAKIGTFDGKNCLFYRDSTGYQEYDTKYLLKTNWKQNTQYKINFKFYPTGTSGQSNLRIVYTDDTSTNLGQGTQNVWNEVNITSDVNKTIKYICGYWASGTDYIDLDTFMVKEVSEGDNTYEPYHEPVTTNIYLDRPLLGIGDTKDYIEFATGKRKNLIKQYYPELYGFNSSLTSLNSCTFNKDIKDIKYGVTNRSKIWISNKFLYSTRPNGYNDEELINKVYDGGDIVGQVGLPKTITSLEEAKNYIGIFNITYELATPTEENVDLPQLNFWEGTNIVEIDTSVPATTEINYITKVN